MKTITREQARQFILSKQGLLGNYRFAGKGGAYDYVCQAGCIQYDPVDVCGKNAELTLQSRVKGFTKEMLADLLYRDRLLVDYADKELSILPVKDWPYFSGYRERSRAMGKSFDGLAELEAQAWPISGKTGPSPVIHCLSKEKSSGILPCIVAVTGLKNPRQPDLFSNSCIPTDHW